MIKIKKESFNQWLEKLNGKEIIISNEGIGDTIICANFAKYFNKAVLRISNNKNNNIFCKDFCTLINVPYFYLSLEEKNNFNHPFIKQFQLHKYFGIQNNEKILHQIYVQDHGFKKSTIKNKDIFICPNGSSVNKNKMIRSITRNDLNLIIEKLCQKKFNIWLVGLEKDISEYGCYENCNWINSNKIINNNFTQNINLSYFLNKVLNCNFAITVATSFEHICGMLGVNTYVLHRLDGRNNPLIKTNDDYFNFFSNSKWYKTIEKKSINELIQSIVKLV